MKVQECQSTTMFPVWLGCKGISPNLWDFPTQPSLLLPTFNLNLTVGMKGGAHALAYAIKKRWSDRNVLQCHLCSMINVVTLWLKGNRRLGHGADETFADGHSATDCLHYEKVKEFTLMRPAMVVMPWHLFLILSEVHASFMMYT